MESSGGKNFEGGRARPRLLAWLTAFAMIMGLAMIPATAAQAGGKPDNPKAHQSGNHGKKPVMPRHREKNPKLPKDCSINVAVVVDRSGSIAKVPGAMANLQGALKGLMDEFVGTGSTVSLVSFAQTARIDVDSEEIDSQADADAFDGPINGLVSSGSTNWQAALQQVQNLSTTPDLVLFMTDGRPNTVVRAGQPVVPPDFVQATDFSQTALVEAVQEANAVKDAGSKIFVVAFGLANAENDFGDTANIALSGNRRLQPGDSIRDADYVKFAGFSTLKASLLSLLSGLCTSIDKKSDPDGTVRAGSTIEYSVKLKNVGRPTVTSDLVDTLPAGVTYVAGSARTEPTVTSRLGAQTLTWEDVSVRGGRSVVVRYEVKVNRGTARGTKLTNTATWNGLEDSTTNTVKKAKSHKPVKHDDDKGKGHDKDSKSDKGHDKGHEKDSKSKAHH